MSDQSKPNPTSYSMEWVYNHLVCEFRHWDVCLSGLVELAGDRLLCRVVCSEADEPQYTLHAVKWTPECDEFLTDYREAYAHWFHEGKPRCNYDGRPLGWFSEKWGRRNPIEEQAQQ